MFLFRCVYGHTVLEQNETIGAALDDYMEFAQQNKQVQGYLELQALMTFRVLAASQLEVRIRVTMVVQSARIAICRRNPTRLPSFSRGSQNNQSNSNAIIPPRSAVAHNITSLAKRNRTAQ